MMSSNDVMMKPVCIIPARAGSKGVSNKNIRNIGGKPLIYYTIKSALESKIFSHVIVSTEDKKTAMIAKKCGAEVPFIRQKYLAVDNTPLEPVLLHTIKKLNLLGIYFEMFVLRDCTVPFIDANDMKGAIKLLKKSKCNSICASIKAHPNPYFQMWEPDSRGFLKISKPTNKTITRRQDAPVVYIVDGLFVFWTKKFVKTRKTLTSKMLPYEITKEHGHMIDFEFDFKVAELLFDQKKRRK